MRYLKSLLILGFSALTSPAEAADYYVPILRSGWKTAITISNSADSSSATGLIHFAAGAQSPREERMEVEPGESKTWSLDTLGIEEGLVALRHMNAESHSALIEVTWVSPLGHHLRQVPSDTSHQGWTWTQNEFTPMKLQIRSLGDQSEDARLLAHDHQNKLLLDQKVSVARSYDSLTLDIPKLLGASPKTPIRWSFIGKRNRYFVLLHHPHRGTLTLAQPSAPPPLVPSKGPAYFLAGLPRKGVADRNTFVISLTDPQLIQLARNSVADPIGAKKVILGKTRPGPDGHNRAFTQTGAPLWSWHMEVQNLVDFASIECDVSPSILEDFLPLFLPQPRTCFWAPSILRELTPAEIVSGVLGAP